ncbi:hypothetical protein HG264_15340 [Pseudomonas sp. gcc21]|uniref:tetratricopeptide repeat protein n=1 Tax=Pseudomonas sp. gcc21 TaxID=2726989 RepID=UPI0014523364|nr:hypothetical protein [Pseudomonas sp. gcc21]QJD60159.1 hypothetical protein HG264_15340 [Pseudomonas sp. gcc21]
MNCLRQCLAAMGICVVLSTGTAHAQQAINPGVFTALNAAQQAQDSGDYANARSRLEAALEQSAGGSLERALVEQRLGYLAIARDRNAEAIDWLRKALAHDQLTDDAARQDRINLAQLLIMQEAYREAVTLLEREHAQQPLGNQPKRLLVQAYSQLQQYSKAIPIAEQVVTAEPGVESSWYQLLAGMNQRLERYREAERWLKVLLKREPDNIQVWRQLAGVQSQGGRQVAAAATLRLAYESGIRFSPSDLDNLVALQVRAGAPWQAARLLQALLDQQLLTGDATRSERLAQLWHQARDHERAHAAWLALANRSGQAEHWLRAAGIQLQQGQWDQLLSSLKQAEPGASAEQRDLIRQWQQYAQNALAEGNS